MTKLLEKRGMEPRTVGDTVLTGKAPWTKVVDEMKASRGCIVLGLSQLHIRTAILKSGTPQEQTIRDVWSPTAWNQIEASMAKMLGLPLLIIRESNVQEIGVLKTAVIPDIQVLECTTPATNWLRTKHFVQPFNEWADEVVVYNSTR